MYQIAFIINLDDGSSIKRKTNLIKDIHSAESMHRSYLIGFYRRYFNIENVIIKIINIETLFIVEYEYDKYKNSVKKEIDLKRSKAMRPQRDYQRQRVYDWESDNFVKYGMFKSVYTPSKMTEFVNFVLEKEGIPELRINYITEGNCSYFKYHLYDQSFEISVNFQVRALNKFLAIHELSHYIIYYKGLPDCGHGKYFVGVYAYLLNKYIKLSKDKIYETLDYRKIDYIDYHLAKKILTLSI